MEKIKKNKVILTLIAGLIFLPAFVFALNDVQISDNTNFELNTYDTAVLTTIVASSGGQVTVFDVQSNYIDITLDNLSTVIFTTVAGGQYLKIDKQSGSDNYTIVPSCPTTTATLTGTGATVVLRLRVYTTNQCIVPPTPPSGGGGGGVINPVNGVCGIANNGAFYYSVPTINLCSTGSPSAVSGSGPWTWTCSGLYGGSTSPKCTANKAVNLPPGCISNLGYSATTGLPCSGTGAPVLPPATPTTCAAYLTKSIQLGAANDSAEVIKLQIFLKDYEGFASLAQTGVYDTATYNAVRSFQSKYASDILIPWGTTTPTGYVYTTTRKKVNEIYCKGTAVPTPVTPVAPVKPITPTPAPVPVTPTIPPICADYLTKPIQLGATNDSAEVIKLQKFLKNYEGFTTLAQTGVYDTATYNAVLSFQSKYASDILIPWGTTTPTGYVYTTTRKKVNEIYCKGNQTPTPVIPVAPVAPVKPATPAIPVTPTQPACAPYITKYIKLGAANDANEVKKLQAFLKDYEGFVTLAQSGVYDKATYNAVKTFQLKYAKDILTPWGVASPTGWVYSTTIKKINEIYCNQDSQELRRLQF